MFGKKVNFEEEKTSEPKNSALSQLVSAIEHFIWGIAVIIFIIALWAGYTFILRPQLNAFEAAQASARTDALNNKKSALEAYKNDMQEFLQKAENVSEDDKKKIETLFVTLEENIILEQQIKKMFTNEYARVLNVEIGAPVQEKQSGPPTGSEQTPSEDFDILNIIQGGGSQAIQEVIEQPRRQAIETQRLQVKVTYASPTYFDAKEMIHILEKTIPLIDIEAFDLIESNGEIQVTLEFIIHFLNR